MVTFDNAIEQLKTMGCDAGYPSDAVEFEQQALESVIHELAHAVVCRMPLDRNPSAVERGKYDPDGLTQRIGNRIGPMPGWAQDRNEETALAVGMVVLDLLAIPYVKTNFIKGVAWKTKRRHRAYVDQALARPTTRRHARRILSYLRFLESRLLG